MLKLLGIAVGLLAWSAVGHATALEDTRTAAPAVVELARGGGSGSSHGGYANYARVKAAEKAEEKKEREAVNETGKNAKGDDDADDSDAADKDEAVGTGTGRHAAH